jgi:hypothetical protein
MKVMKISSIKFAVMLALGLLGGQVDSHAMEQAPNNSQNAPTLPTYRSQKVEVNNLIDQDEIKNFAYQAKRTAKEAAKECPCNGCSCYAKNAKNLWQAIRNENDTSSQEVKNLIEKFATHHHVATRLSQDFTTWLNLKGYQTLSKEEILHQGFKQKLDFLIMMSLFKDLFSADDSDKEDNSSQNQEEQQSDQE